jgi:hypothetical protein
MSAQDSFPVLTEVLTGHPSKADLASPTSLEPDFGSTQIHAQDLAELERTVREQVLNRLLQRVDNVVDLRLKMSVDEVVSRHMDRLNAELKQNLHDTLREVVARAVSQEVARLHSVRTGGSA